MGLHYVHGVIRPIYLVRPFHQNRVMARSYQDLRLRALRRASPPSSASCTLPTQPVTSASLPYNAAAPSVHSKKILYTHPPISTHMYHRYFFVPTPRPAQTLPRMIRFPQTILLNLRLHCACILRRNTSRPHRHPRHGAAVCHLLLSVYIAWCENQTCMPVSRVTAICPDTNVGAYRKDLDEPSPIRHYRCR